MNPVHRILYLDHAPIFGGAEVVLLGFLCALDRERFAPLVVTAADAEWLPALAERHIETATVPFGRLNQAGAAMPINLLRTAWAVAQIVRRRNITLIHTNTVRAHIVGTLAARLTRTPLVWTLHDNTLPLRVVHWLGSTPTRVITVSGWLSDLYAPCGLAGKIVVIPNGIDVRAPASSDVNVRDDFQIPADVPIVINVGRLVAGKAPHLFVQAARHVVDAIPQARFALIGSEDRSEPGQRRSDYADLLASAIHESQLTAEQMIVAGQRTDVANIYAAADLVVYNAVQPEGLPTVLLEAMCAAKPIVASAIGGALEIVQDGVTGLLVPPGDVPALSAAMVALLRDPARARALGRAGRARLEKNFDLQQQARKIEWVYSEIYANHA